MPNKQGMKKTVVVIFADEAALPLCWQALLPQNVAFAPLATATLDEQSILFAQNMASPYLLPLGFVCLHP